MTKQHEAGWQCPECRLCRETLCGPDPCLGELPGVLFACCGHDALGENRKGGYIYFENGVIIRFSRLTSREKIGDEDLATAKQVREDYGRHWRR